MIACGDPRDDGPLNGTWVYGDTLIKFNNGLSEMNCTDFSFVKGSYIINGNNMTLNITHTYHELDDFGIIEEEGVYSKNEFNVLFDDWWNSIDQDFKDLMLYEFDVANKTELLKIALSEFYPSLSGTYVLSNNDNTLTLSLTDDIYGYEIVAGVFTRQ